MRFRVSRNHHPMSCFQVVEWRVLRKHRFFRWYRVSDHPGSFRSSKSLNGDFSGSIYVLVIWCVSGCVATSIRCPASKSVNEELSGSIASLGGIESAIIHFSFRSSKSLNGEISGSICVLVIWGRFGVSTSFKCPASRSLNGDFSGSIASLAGIESAIIQDTFGSSNSLNGVLSKHLCSGILGRFRVSRNHHPMSCFQVVEWRVLRKHRFFRWY